MKLVLTFGTLSALVACGGGQASGPPQQPAAAEPASEEDWGDAGASALAEPDAGATSEPTAISCISMKVCTEMKVAPKEAAEAKERCVGASGESHDGPCSRDAVLATCTLPKNQAIIFYYRDDNADMERGRIKGGKPGCASAKGKFQVVAKAK